MLNQHEINNYIGREAIYYDVIVAGGGPAGIGAALAAAKAGAKTLLLEARGYLGGVAPNAFWMPFNRIFLNGKARSDIHDSIVQKLRSLGKGACVPGRSNHMDGDNLNIHPDYLRLALLELLEEAGCDYVLYSPVTGVELAEDADGNGANGCDANADSCNGAHGRGTDANSCNSANGCGTNADSCNSVNGCGTGSVLCRKRVRAVKTTWKAVENTYYGKIFIDCTGDGDLCALSGAQTMFGEEGSGKTMFVTLGFTIAGVDTEKFFREIGIYMTLDQVRARIAPEDTTDYAFSPWYSFDWTTLPGVISCNNGGWKDVGILNATKPEDLTRAERGGIQVAHDFIKMARTNRFPGLENCELGHAGATLGVRETRRIVCDYIQSGADARAETSFDDIVARRYGAMDFAGSDKDAPMKSGYPFPYRALLVKGFDGLLTAGRCGSFTREGLAAGKSMGNMIELGTAAGAAAALSVKRGVMPRELNVSELQSLLRSWNVKI